MERETSGGIRQPWGWENVEEYEMVSLSVIDDESQNLGKTSRDGSKIRDSSTSLFSIPGLAIGFVFICILVALLSGINHFVDIPAIEHPPAPRCMDNSVCHGLGISGDCCPTLDGVDLDCCSDPANEVAMRKTLPGACDDNSVCASMGVEGMCCLSEYEDDDTDRDESPLLLETELDCCLRKDNKVSLPHTISAVCSANSACLFAKLTSGNCCPTDDGIMLGCCPPLSD